MLPTVRHQTAPTPLGCRWYGVDQRGHAIHYTPGHPRHTWTEPTRAQIEARLRVRLAQPRTFPRLTAREPTDAQ